MRRRNRKRVSRSSGQALRLSSLWEGLRRRPKGNRRVRPPGMAPGQVPDFLQGLGLRGRGLQGLVNGLQRLGIGLQRLLMALLKGVLLLLAVIPAGLLQLKTRMLRQDPASHIQRRSAKRSKARAVKSRSRPRHGDEMRDRLVLALRGMQASGEPLPIRPPPRQIRWVAALFALCFAILSVRAADLQLMDGAYYANRAKRQALAKRKIKAQRGQIRDREGRMLAVSVEMDSVYAHPRRIGDAHAASKALAPVLGLSQADLEDKLSRDTSFVYLKRRVDAETQAKVKALEIPGIGSHREPKRFYPNLQLAAHVLGYTDYRNEGRSGVEHHFDEALQGQSEENWARRDARGRRLYVAPVKAASSYAGNTVELTLDANVQHVAEHALRRTVETYKARSATAIVMVPKTGEILALANYPSFNPNNLSPSRPEDRKNTAISSVYDPGSTLKIVTIAEALELGLVNPNTVMDCEQGQYEVGSYKIRDAGHHYDKLSVTDVMRKSSNICAAKLGLALGRKRLDRALRRFGFGELSGIELTGEVRGLLRPANKWREIDLATIAFGQGMSATSLQVLQMAAIVANGGTLVRPHLLRRILNDEGQVIAEAEKRTRRVVSERTARQLTEMMQGVTEAGGTAVLAAIPGLSVAGKTGTAQKLDPKTHRYSRDLYVASFVGYAPAEAPEVAVLVSVNEPMQGSYYGGKVAGPAFKEIALAALASRGVYPVEPEDRKEFLAQFQALSQWNEGEVPAPAKQTAQAAQATQTAQVTRGEAQAGDPKREGRIAADDPRVLSDAARAILTDGRPQLERGETPPLKAQVASPGGAEGVVQMPDLSGLSLSEVLVQMANAGCDPKVKGSGWAYRQSPKPGTPISAGDRCEVELSLSTGSVALRAIGRSVG